MAEYEESAPGPLGERGDGDREHAVEDAEISDAESVPAGVDSAAAVEEKDVERQMEKPLPESASPANEPAAVQAGAVRPEDPASADDVITKKMPGHEAGDALVLAESRQHTRRSFAMAAVGVAAGYGFYRWLGHSRELEMQPELLRRAFMANAALSRGIFDDRALAPTYALSRAETLRVNGIYGLKQQLLPESWRLQLVGVKDAATSPRFAKDVTAWEYRYTAAPAGADKGHDTKVAPSADTAEKMAPAPMVAREEVRQERAGRMPRGQEEAGESRSTLKPGTSGLLLTLDDIARLPRHELVTQFKCIEGWSQIVHWAGVRMADFLEAYPPAPIDGKEPKYVYMETPNGDYYCGYDMQVCRHPQTLLVTEMMGAPLTESHGAPLRLHMPTKYGYKQIKRIGLISYTNTKPDDYWTKLGYDWYAGL
jgi:DMSO/TMAO reductase YedYZ molybdopterin-dependent catalytic subunit